ncbi:MAG TPA: serine hydrolase [Chitinophagaceae bacterium]|nr:serine hydrolase [Chitinophagaceae bacterium]
MMVQKIIYLQRTMSLRKAPGIFVAVLVLLLLYGIYYCWISFPIVSGYGAKAMCSAIFVSGRDEREVRSQDLNFMPLKLATYRVSYRDSSVTCSIFGFTIRKAIYRKGLGATLVNEISETALRAQKFRLATRPRIRTDTIPWPMGDRIAGNFPPGVDSSLVTAAVAKVFEPHHGNYINLTRALIVVYDGQIIAERYAPGITAHTRLPGWSMAKSVTSALIGLLVKQQKINIDDPAPVPEWKKIDDPRHNITVKNLLQQSSGLDFEEVYDKAADANRMLFMKRDAAAFAAKKSLRYPPDVTFRYSSGTSNILSRICRHVIGDRDYYAFPSEQLFFPLGMYNTVLEPDPSGTLVGSSFCFATARDWARFGLLYLNNGVSNGSQILPEGWVRQSTTPAPAAEEGEYGFQWWLNAGEKNNPENCLFPGLPEDMFFADGYEGQNIFVIPSQKLVVVRLGLTRNANWGEDELLHSIIKSIRRPV